MGWSNSLSMDTIWTTAGQDILVLGQAFLAIVLGGAIGFEREAAGKRAGLRTNMLVCLAAFLFTRISVMMTEDAAAILDAGLVMADPVRIIQAIVIGISFLGAGVIIREPDGDRIHGVTTAATLLVVAPVGVAVALHHYVLALGITALTLLVLRVLHGLEDRIFDHES
jgi:putative Mg2+ transporter-C (MgtC) family protein